MPETWDVSGTHRTLFGKSILALMALAWFGFAVWLPGLGIMVCIIHLACMVFDLLMNGNPRSDLLGPNAAGAMLAGAGAWLGLGLHAT